MANKVLFYGYNPPFWGGPQNILSRQEDDRLIKNDILQLLLTVPGERVMRPDFGVSLRSFVFEQATDADLASLEREITEKLTTYEPRVIVNAVQLTRLDDQNAIRISILARMVNDPTKVISIEKVLNGEI